MNDGHKSIAKNKLCVKRENYNSAQLGEAHRTRFPPVNLVVNRWLFRRVGLILCVVRTLTCLKILDIFLNHVPIKKLGCPSNENVICLKNPWRDPDQL